MSEIKLLKFLIKFSLKFALKLSSYNRTKTSPHVRTELLQQGNGQHFLQKLTLCLPFSIFIKDLVTMKLLLKNMRGSQVRQNGKMLTRQSQQAALPSPCNMQHERDAAKSEQYMNHLSPRNQTNSFQLVVQREVKSEKMSLS